MENKKEIIIFFIISILFISGVIYLGEIKS